MSELALDQQQPLTQVERVTNTFAAPSKTFFDIFRSKSWWLPFVLIALVGYAFSGVVLARIGVTPMVEHALQQRAEKTGQQMAPEQVATATKVTAAIFKASFAAAPIIFLLAAVIFTVLIWLGFNFILGGKASFSGMFAVSIYASLPSIVKSLLTIVTILFTTNDNFDIQNPIGTNIGYFLGPDASPFLKSLLTSLDLFSIWMLALFALGGAIQAKVKPRTGFLLVFGAWLAYALIRSAMA